MIISTEVTVERVLMIGTASRSAAAAAAASIDSIAAVAASALRCACTALQTLDHDDARQQVTDSQSYNVQPMVDNKWYTVYSCSQNCTTVAKPESRATLQGFRQVGRSRRYFSGLTAMRPTTAVMPNVRKS